MHFRLLRPTSKPIAPHCRESILGRIPPLCLIIIAIGALFHPRVGHCDETDKQPDPRGIEFFESKIRPVLVRSCYKCHSSDAGKSEGSLLLDSREMIRNGGERGPAVVPGDPEASLLLTAITFDDPDLQMPPVGNRLSESVVADFAAWIKMGAPDPRKATSGVARISSIDIEAGRKFWSFQKPVDHELPETQDPNWARRDLDHFVLATLESNSLEPSPDADPAVLLRRLHFDLVGLPPTPQTLSRFLKRTKSKGIDAALTEQVDTLLSSERFGERWGRHWLDVARYAESSGKESNVTFPYAWRFRDYVIDAINADVPYDRFVTEQIAGDLLPFENDAERARLLIATGFLALGPKNLNEMNFFQFLADVADEQIDTTSRAILANTIACARCHDHKFDPYSMEDYYALAGVFASTKTNYGTSVAPQNQVGGDLITLPDLPGQAILHKSVTAKRITDLKDQLAALKKEEKDGRAAVFQAIKDGEDPSGLFTLQDALRILWRSGSINGQLKKYNDQGEALPLALGVMDREQPVDVPLLERGEISKPGEKIPRRFPEIIEFDDLAEIPADQSGRLQFARWLTHPEHPLTARVMTNRVWRHLFGQGIVRTVDNFGHNGEAPSHPELLDHLAIRFVNGGWSLKSLIREIVLSRTYRQTSDYREDAFHKDPDNRFLWRASKRRLDAEAIRDAMLAVSGNLDTARPEGSLVGRIGDRPISIIGFDKRITPDMDGTPYRSVYLPVIRDRLPDVLDLFDFAEPSLVTGDRETTNVPLQALYLMNSSFIRHQAEGLADRLISQTKRRRRKKQESQIRQAYLLCFGRSPDIAENQMAIRFFEQGSHDSKLPIDKDEAARELMANYCQALLATAEFRNID